MATRSFSSTSVNRHFFKPLIPGFNTHMEIPNRFYSEMMNKRERGYAYAELRSNASEMIWKVKKEGQRLTKGWDEFTSAHDLKNGDILVFKHEGNLVFHVSMFGRTCCEIEFSNSASEDENNVKDRPRKRKRVKTEAANCSSDKSEFVLSVTVSNLKSDSLPLPRHFTGSSGLSKQCKEITVMDEHKKSWKVKMGYSKSSSRFRLINGWRLLCHANDYRAGDFMKIKLIRNNNTILLQVLPLGNQIGEKKKVKTEAAHCSLDNPEFVLSVTVSNLKTDSLNLPKHFTGSSGLSKQCDEITIMDEQKKPWKVKMSYSKSTGRFRLKNGWRLLCHGNDYKAGDFMKLKLIRNSNTTLLQVLPSENEIEVESLEAKVEKIEENSSNFFMVSVTSSNLRDDRVFLPVGFSKIVKKGLSEIDLMNIKGKTWRVNLEYMKSSQRARISKGWRRFCEENGRKDGSYLKFELVTNMETTLLRVSC